MLTFIEQEALSKAVLFKLFVLAQSTDELIKNDALASEFGISVGSKRISLAFETLSESNFIKYNVASNRATISSEGYKIVEAGLRDKNSFFAKYSASGDDWLSEQTIGSEAIPASNRIVYRSDNEKQYEQIDDNLEIIIEQLKTDNSVGDELGDDREIMIAESTAAKDLIAPSRFHLGRLANLILPTLKFISEKFAGAAIGEAAKRLVSLILALF